MIYIEANKGTKNTPNCTAATALLWIHCAATCILNWVHAWLSIYQSKLTPGAPLDHGLVG